MTAIDNDERVFAPVWEANSRRTSLALAGTATALVIAVGAFLLHGGDQNAARFAAQTVFRASSVAFLLYYLARPLARLVPTRPTLVMGRLRAGLALAFVCMYAVFLACTLVPDYLSAAHAPLPTLVFAVFSTIILSVVLLGERAGATDPSWRAAWRTMESIGVAYFWVVYAVNDLDHMYGPHRPDGYYGASLSILCLALLVRFADAFKQRLARA